MSLEMMTACADVQCSGLAKSVLMVLADHFPGAGIADLPSRGFIERRACWSEEQVNLALSELLARNILLEVKSPYGHYQLNPGGSWRDG